LPKSLARKFFVERPVSNFFGLACGALRLDTGANKRRKPMQGARLVIEFCIDRKKNEGEGKKIWK
jgi:hypothetical protein